MGVEATDGEDAQSPQPDKESSSLVKEHIGDLFAAPDDSVLIHACNTVGSWGAGIAAAFRQRYPKAYQIYNKHCTKDHNPRTNPVPTGTCLLIPPVETKPGAPKHWIGCLFTSAKYGRAKDPPRVILQHTGPAFDDFLAQLSLEPSIKQVRMCQINAGLFAVPWDETRKAVETALGAHASQVEVHVYTPASLPTNRTFAKGPVKESAKGSVSRARPVAKGPPTKTQTASKGQATLNSFVTRN